MDQNVFDITKLDDPVPRYKLTYFNARVRAETSRLIFAAADVDYEDHRISFTDGVEWPAMKADMPFGQLPVLQTDNKVLCQSHAIEHYLARQFGLAGKTHYDQARTDMIVQCIEDAGKTLISIIIEKDEDKKEEIRQKYEEEDRPKFLDYFDRIYKEGRKQGHFVGSDITYADMAFYNFVDNPSAYGLTQIEWDRWPDLKKVFDNVADHPKISEWLEKRPDTPF